MTEDPKVLVALLRLAAARMNIRQTEDRPLMKQAADLIDRLTADRERSVGEDVVERKPVTLDALYGYEAGYEDGQRAVIAATPPRVPDGFVLVPMVPTEAMLKAGGIAEVHKESGESEEAFCQRYAAQCWSAMIAAAPAPALPETGLGNTNLENRDG